MDAETNTLLIDWDQPFGLPPFAQIRAEDFRPAFERAMRLHSAELAAIAQHGGAAGFDNTVAAFDRAGTLLGRIQAVFYNLTASATSPALQAVQREMAAPLAAHWSAVYQDA
ncbi:MAG TPA: peptidase M3, partial [Aquabacterium sp.]|nr:peptidase M3 [Aquabacterium sp.]